MSGCNDDKETFYNNLDSLMKSTPDNHKPFLLGNFNVRVESNHRSWKYVMAPHGLEKMNSKGLLPLTIYTENDLTITNMHFRMANKYKTMRMHPTWREWNFVKLCHCPQVGYQWCQGHHSHVGSRMFDGSQIGQISSWPLYCPNAPQETEICEEHIQHHKTEMIRCQEEPVPP